MVGEDSGIEAAALDGRPGIASARWAADGVERLLCELEGAADRRARYVCVIVAIGPRGEEVLAEGTLDGAIATARSGAEGFGYDPIFVPEGEERTVAELGNGWKARNSHRARAAASLAETLAEPHLPAPASVGAVDAQEALAELTTLSSQIEDAAVLGESGSCSRARGRRSAVSNWRRSPPISLAAAADVRASGEVSRVEVRVGSTSVFVVVEGGRTAVATTVPEPTAGLVLYDLRTALRRLEEPDPERPKATRKKAADA